MFLFAFWAALIYLLALGFSKALRPNGLGTWISAKELASLRAAGGGGTQGGG